jgi:hypothetical protein
MTLSSAEEVPSQSNEGAQSEQKSPMPQEIVDESLSDFQWDAIRKATKSLKPNKFNIGALLLDCVKRYTEDGTLVVVFKTRANMERLQGEMENPDTRRLLEETVEHVTGTAYNLRLRLVDQAHTERSAPMGHLVRAAQAIGARIIDEVESEEKSNE